MQKKIRLGVIFGGKSPEHINSVESGLYILTYIDSSKYDIHAIYIKEDGSFASPAELMDLVPGFFDNKDVSIFEKNKKVPEDLINLIKSFVVYPKNSIAYNKSNFFENLLNKSYDIIFPVLHGKNGEDGTIQGLLELLDIPYVGCGVLGSAVGLDKEITKRICMANNIPVCDFVVVRSYEWYEDKNKIKIIDTIKSHLSFPVFVKPANLGSSIGITKAESVEQLINGIEKGLEFDKKVLVEKGLNAREYGIGVIGNETLEFSVIGEYKSCNGFLDYDSKYGLNAMDDEIPAQLPDELAKELQRLAGRVYKSLELTGLARIDFFITPEGIYVNEVNTMPGFGAHSAFPKMWEASGVSVKELIDNVILLGLERFNVEGEFVE